MSLLITESSKGLYYARIDNRAIRVCSTYLLNSWFFFIIARFSSCRAISFSLAVCSLGSALMMVLILSTTNFLTLDGTHSFCLISGSMYWVTRLAFSLNSSLVVVLSTASMCYFIKSWLIEASMASFGALVLEVLSFLAAFFISLILRIFMFYLKFIFWFLKNRFDIKSN